MNIGIEFRAYDALDEKMFYFDFNDLLSNTVPLHPSSGDWTLMQYIGLIDKNNKKIYEGDICRIQGGENFNGIFEFDKISEIKRQTCMFDFVVNGVGYGLGFCLEINSIEVIGNIYNNPELLNTK